MKKILMSLMLIALVASVAAGGTLAFFSDTEKAPGLFASGTIDIEVNEQNPWSESVEFIDMKPSDWEYQKFIIHNVGTNEGPLYLHLKVIESGDALDGSQNPIVSEPECEAEGGTWTSPNGPCESRVAINDIENHITIDLTVDGNMMISPDDHVKLGDLDCHYIPLGWLGFTSDTIEVELSFHLQDDTGNEYQGDMVSFEIEFYMTDHNAPPPEGSMILLENKDAEWNVIDDDNLWGYAMYYASDLELFVYAEGLTPGANYQISINSPEDATWYPITGAADRIGMAEALAAGVYGTGTTAAPPTGYNLFERGYYDLGTGGNLQSGPPGTWEGDDIGTFTTSQTGVTPRTITANIQGSIMEWVSFPLPSGEYQHIKVVVKEDFSPWNTILMEATTPLFFTIP